MKIFTSGEGNMRTEKVWRWLSRRRNVKVLGAPGEAGG